MNDEMLQQLERRAMACLPDEARRRRGPYAVFECFQQIPCNPCRTSCPFGAVLPMADLCETPQIDYDRCVGCGVCLSVCPGLAAFVIDETFSDEESLVKIPYEYAPLPQGGQEVDGVDRLGETVCRVRVEAVKTFGNRTSVLSLAVPKPFTHRVRGIRISPREQLITEGGEAGGGESIVCRCEDVTEEELRAALGEGLDSLKQLKLHTRVSMGPCQGKTCIALVMRELSAANGRPVGELRGPKYRLPIQPIQISAFLDKPEK
ncbi:MAG: (2Fe-2S)-binding protein [Oscillospiraceae bacterium]|nr:MAG: (2Fe-2S)-binding protein [Oscillospiraceae bacterium]